MDSESKIEYEALWSFRSNKSTNKRKIDTPESSHDQPNRTDREDTGQGTGEIINISGQDGDNNHPQKGSFLSLQLSSDRNQVYSLTQQVELSQSQEQDLERKRDNLTKTLSTMRKRRKTIDIQLKACQQIMRTERNAAGISEELWREYEAFCETLQPNGSKERHSFAWNESYNDSYIKYDPNFTTLDSTTKQEPANWRCDCVTFYTKGGTPIRYEVDYYRLTKVEGTTWEGGFPRLYRLAIDAAKQGSVAALEMLVALPDKGALSLFGWVFEFGFKESRSSHPDLSQRWGFRASYHRLFPGTKEAKRARITKSYGLPIKDENES
ncbi:hypothetical protein F5Y12DRAFT_645083 [Xylaria sp. FL1777]|nr:hypothetical protein F5Y12DRAFT_645083 [Xylaria sp. FL1777]